MSECRKEYSDAEKVKENTAGLPAGWKWNDYEDGSGSLRAPDGTSYFSYDRAPYGNAGGIEYKREKGMAWDVYWGPLSSFKTYAEEFVTAHIVDKYFKKEESILCEEKEGHVEVKTLEGWEKFTNETGKSSWGEYVKPGDLVDEKTADYFLNIMPPASMNYGYFQVGEPYEHLFDEETGRYKAVFPTFIKAEEGTWKWCGNCFKGKTEEPKKETEVQQENVLPKKMRGGR